MLAIEREIGKVPQLSSPGESDSTARFGHPAAAAWQPFD